MKAKPRGFSLLEMALVLGLMSVLLAGMMQPLASTREQLDRRLATAQLQRIETALIGHLLARGRLPCAATRESGGVELVADGGCEQYSGFLPAATLGLPGGLDADGLLLDPWNRPYLYRLSASDANLDNRADYAVAGGVVLQSPLEVRADIRILAAVDAACGRRAVRAEAVVAIVLSQGRSDARSLAERENTDADTDFVSRLISDAENCRFDDQLMWLTENRLLTLMLNAGVLPRPD